MARRLYYDDPDLLAFDAKVTAARAEGERTLVALDQTAFYPSSGGQPFDTGSLSSAETRAQVLDVNDDDAGEVWHVLDGAPALRPGDRVHGEIDPARRRDHRQQHTGQHLLSALLWDTYRIATVSFHLGADSSTIDIDAPAFSPEQIGEITFSANRIIRESLPVTIHYGTVAEARARGVRKIAPGHRARPHDRDRRH